MAAHCTPSRDTFYNFAFNFPEPFAARSLGLGFMARQQLAPTRAARLDAGCCVARLDDNTARGHTLCPRCQWSGAALTALDSQKSLPARAMNVLATHMQICGLPSLKGRTEYGKTGRVLVPVLVGKSMNVFRQVCGHCVIKSLTPFPEIPGH